MASLETVSTSYVSHPSACGHFSLPQNKPHRFLCTLGGMGWRVAATGPRSLGVSGTGTDGDPSFSHRHPKDKRIERDDSPPAARRRSEAHKGGGRGGALATRREEEEEEEDTGGEQEALAEHGRARSLFLSREEVDRQPISAGEGQPIDGQSSAEDAEQPLRLEEHETGGKLPPSPFPLVGLLVLFFFLYVGIEVGFGAWVAVVVLRDDLAGQQARLSWLGGWQQQGVDTAVSPLGVFPPDSLGRR